MVDKTGNLPPLPGIFPDYKATRRGFGSTLIEQLIPFEMNGMSKPQFLPAGFVLDVH